MTGKEAYKDLMQKLFQGEDNPTYELCGVTLENLYGLQAVNEMEDLGLIKYVGQNHNNLSVFKVR